jgi:hypothetical protein
MTRTTNARVAGFALLFYIAAGITSLVLFGKATPGEGVAATLDGIARNLDLVRFTLILHLLECFSAFVLAVTFFALTRDVDPDLARLGMICRVAEGVIGAVGVPGTMALIWLATATGANAPDPTSARTLAAYLLRNDVAVTATFFAAGSLCFCILLLRGRLIPVALAWIGVVASVLLVIALPLQAAGWLRGMIANLIWLPMLLFEVPVAVWLLVKGVSQAPMRPGLRGV